MTTSARIRDARLRQPVDVLQRKAEKARVKSNLWTQEEIDLAHAQGGQIFSYVKRMGRHRKGAT